MYETFIKIQKQLIPWYKNIWFVTLSLYSLWILIGILYYKFVENWTYATAYFYAIEAGLSIGFCYPTERTDATRLFTVVYVLLGSSVVVGSLGGLGQEVLGEQKARIVQRDHRFIFDMSNFSGFFGFLSLLWYNFKILIGWYKFRRSLLFFFLLSGWMLLSIIWAMSYLGWSFIKSLYFAVTTLSTGGLQGPPCLNNTTGLYCEIDQVAAIIVGIYGMIGVPLYFLTLGTFAGAIVEHSIKARHKAKLFSPIEAKDFLYATKLLSDQHSTTLNLGEFVLLELMRLGVTDRKQIERIRIKFQELDIKKNNVLDYDELCQGGYLIQSISHPHFLSRTKSGTDLIHITPQTASPFHDNNNEGTIISHHLLPIEEEDDKDEVREDVLQEIQKMQRARSASIAKLEMQDLLFYDDTLLNDGTAPLRRNSLQTKTLGSSDIIEEGKLNEEEEALHPLEI